MRKTPLPKEQTGTVNRLIHESEVLKGNPWGDPAVRQVAVYTPPGYEEGEKYPLFVDLVGYTGSGLAHVNWKNFGYNVPERLDRLIADGKMGPAVCVFPDCFTSVGGQSVHQFGGNRPLRRLHHARNRALY